MQTPPNIELIFNSDEIRARVCFSPLHPKLLSIDFSLLTITTLTIKCAKQAKPDHYLVFKYCCTYCLLELLFSSFHNPENYTGDAN